MKYMLTVLLFIASMPLFSQSSPGAFLADKKTGCQVWVAGGYAPSDSLAISWDGACKNRMADGYGRLAWFVKGKEVSSYTGFMQKGNPNGKGKYNFMGGAIAEGNFSEGEILNLDEPYLKRLEKNIVSQNDSTDMYVNDGNSKTLFYDILIPPGPVKGVVVLLPGSWDPVKYVFSCNKDLSQSAFDRDIAVIVPSVNQRLSLNADVLDFLNKVFTDAISRYSLPKDKFILGGFSMGGLFSLRYTELSRQNKAKTTVVPKAAYSVDGPTDLANMYHMEQRAYEKHPDATEPKYALNEFKRYFGGSPDKFPAPYLDYSVYSKSEKDGGNAKYLEQVPIRIYNDVDVNWWLSNRGYDLYDMNALDQSALINLLNSHGNKQAIFINAFGKGYRLDGARHPHSWSIVDAADCIKWILGVIAQ